MVCRVDMSDPCRVVRMEFSSDLGMLDLVQVVSGDLARGAGLDQDGAHWVDVAVRESVVNAITHGNQLDPSRRVFVEFETTARALTISVRDQGQGFDPAALPDPLAPENLLKDHGRGIFLIRCFMDDVQLLQAPEGGMRLRMTKRLAGRVAAPASGHE